MQISCRWTFVNLLSPSFQRDLLNAGSQPSISILELTSNGPLGKSRGALSTDLGRVNGRHSSRTHRFDIARGPRIGEV